MGLVSREAEALVGKNFEILALLSEPLCYACLVTVAELELLVDEAVLFEELVEAALSDVLDHLLLEVSGSLCGNLCADVLSLVSILLSQPALSHVRLDVIIRVNEVGVDASLLQSDIDLALDLLFLGLLDSHAELLVNSSLRNRSLVESDRLHSSHLHGYLVACILVSSRELNHSAQCVAAHMVVGVDVLALKHIVAIEFHLLTDNARATCHSLGNLQTISQCQFLYFVECLRLSSDGSIENVLSELNIVSTVGHEVT